MLNRLLSAALTGCLLLLTGSPAFAYYSKDSYEGEVTFTSMVEIAEDTPDFLIMPSYINRQLLYLAGPLQAAPKKAAAKNDAKDRRSRKASRRQDRQALRALPLHRRRSFSTTGFRTS